jgi:hypothetical protein
MLWKLARSSEIVCGRWGADAGIPVIIIGLAEFKPFRLPLPPAAVSLGAKWRSCFRAGFQPGLANMSRQNLT